MRANHQQDQIRIAGGDTPGMGSDADFSCVADEMRPLSATEFSRISPEPQRPSEPTPIWMAALIASRCHANGNVENHSIAWTHVAGRALYTNPGPESETIQPL